MRKTELSEILATVESIRKERYPDLDASFVAAVVQAEDQNPEDDTEAERAIEAALKKSIQTRGVS